MSFVSNTVATPLSELVHQVIGEEDRFRVASAIQLQSRHLYLNHLHKSRDTAAQDDKWILGYLTAIEDFYNLFTTKPAEDSNPEPDSGLI